MTKEERFNRIFNLFILVGMISVVCVVNVLKMQEPEANVVKLLIVSAFTTHTTLIIPTRMNKLNILLNLSSLVMAP